MKYKVNILGSCVSRVSMLDGNLEGHNIADGKRQFKYAYKKYATASILLLALWRI